MIVSQNRSPDPRIKSGEKLWGSCSRTPDIEPVGDAFAERGGEIAFHLDIAHAVEAGERDRLRHALPDIVGQIQAA